MPHEAEWLSSMWLCINITSSTSVKCVHANNVFLFLLEREGVVSVFPNTEQKLMTTRSWDFLRMTRKVKRNIRLETNMIIAVLDTGQRNSPYV